MTDRRKDDIAQCGQVEGYRVEIPNCTEALPALTVPYLYGLVLLYSRVGREGEARGVWGEGRRTGGLKDKGWGTRDEGRGSEGVDGFRLGCMDSACTPGSL